MFHENNLMKQQSVGLLTNGKFGKPCLTEFWKSAYDLEIKKMFNPLNTKLNPICHQLALLAAHYILHVSRIRVNFYLLGLNARSTSSGLEFFMLATVTYIYGTLIYKINLSFKLTVYQNFSSFTSSF